MSSHDELSPEEKLLKVIQDGGQVDPGAEDDSEAATIVIPAREEPGTERGVDGPAAGEASADDPDAEPDRRLRLASRESDASGAQEDATAEVQSEAPGTAELSDEDAGELIGVGVPAAADAVPAAGRSHFSVNHLNKILAVAVFVLIGIAFFEIASGFTALKSELGDIDREVKSGPDTPSIRGNDIEEAGESEPLLKKIGELQAHRINVWTPDTVVGVTTNPVIEVNHNQVLTENIQILFSSGDSEIYLKRKRSPDAPADFYSVGTDIKVLNYVYKIKSVSRESVCFEINDKEICLE
ncbi:MAG: hypothetical protein O2923_13245 [Verrucomicrobia bacterium]|nr:hypothetical protein [Verrucomicrobiota bacterium]MDA1087928.1 hypothetical protein [Verrucomicrobiota bacterium]